MSTSRPSLVSPPPPYSSLQADPSCISLPTHPIPFRRPLPIRRATAPARLIICHPAPALVKPAHRRLVSRISSAFKVSIPNLQSPASTRPNKLRKQRPPTKDCSRKLTVDPCLDSQDEANSSNSEHPNRIGQRRRLGPIIAFVTRTPVHFFTGDSEVLEVKTIWPDGRELVTKPNQITRSSPEEWRGWPSQQQ